MVAADAGLMQIQLREGAVSRCAEVVRQSTTDASGRGKGDESAKTRTETRVEKVERRGLWNGKAQRD